MKNAIRIKDLKKSYGEQTVLDGFSCCFDDSTALMGASGKGKSTLLRLILGLEKAEEGQITTDVPPRFAVVFQEDRLFDSFDAIENVIVGFKGKIPREQATERAAALLSRLGIDSSEHRKPVRDHSGGMRRRVAIARALVSEFNVLVLDEPYKGLDEETRAICAETIAEHTRDTLVILVTHDRDEATLTGIGRIVTL